mmetsp:Transcript_12395/g.15819  ORF Transcript_12395/g.15819 Transcript_12395/m.15819 type:complete len:93 (+) Transcript_12395:161-439(+)
MNNNQEFDPSEWNYSSAPPKPIYNSFDNKECRKNVDELNEGANSTYEYSKINNEKLDKSYKAILRRQSDYGVQLANNKEFEAWSISDWEESF